MLNKVRLLQGYPHEMFKTGWVDAVWAKLCYHIKGASMLKLTLNWNKSTHIF